MLFEREIIVIVEDEADTADMFAEMMDLLGYHVFKSVGGVRALDLIAEKKPAVVLLDLMMPELSGLDILGLMRRDPGLADIPVIIVSAKGLPSDIKSGLDAGATRYLTKPVSFADLREAVDAVVKN